MGEYEFIISKMLNTKSKINYAVASTEFTEM